MPTSAVRIHRPDELDAVREGRDPAGVSFDPAAPPVQFTAGNFVQA